MHEKIKDNPSMPVHRIYCQVANSDSGDSDDVQQFSSFRSRLKRYRAQFVPALPVDIDDVDIQGDWARTRRGNQFLNHIDNQWGLAIFTTSKLIRALANSDCAYIDGTFRTAPYPYDQFVTIHGLRNGFVVPLVFCLLNGKTVGQYRQLLQQLKREVRRLTGGLWRPNSFVLDFEQSMFIAIQTELPGVQISGCYFHFTQSLWRHIQSKDLVCAYRRSRRLRITVRKVMAIGFLPLLLVRQNFVLLRNSRQTRRLIGRFPKLDDWLDYVQTTYVNVNSPFPPSSWNVFNRDCYTRTNNHVEG
jgi:hypothetical protein